MSIQFGITLLVWFFSKTFSGRSKMVIDALRCFSRKENPNSVGFPNGNCHIIWFYNKTLPVRSKMIIDELIQEKFHFWRVSNWQFLYHCDFTVKLFWEVEGRFPRKNPFTITFLIQICRVEVLLITVISKSTLTRGSSTC